MRRPRPPTTPYLRLPGAGSVVSFLVVAGVIAFTIFQLHPSLLLANTTASGGDTGSQVGLPYYFEHGILSHLRLTGWSPWWYDGYPQYTFYFPLPGLFVAILNLVMPYNVAFKLITVAGSLLLPIAVWAFGRLSGMRRPGPELMAVFTLPYLFSFSFPSIYQIVGGNLASTLAGEYSYSLSLAFGVLFLGLVARGLDTGKRRGLAAVLLAATALCHVIPAIFVGVMAFVLTLTRLDWGRLCSRLNRNRLWWAFSAGLAGVAIIGFWAIPFVAGLPYTSSLGFSKETAFGVDMFPAGLLAPVALGAVGAVISVVRKHRTGVLLVIMAVVSAVLIIADPTKALYNARFLPFWVLSVYMLAAVGVAELVTMAVGLGAWLRWRSARPARSDLGKSVLAALAAVEAEASARLAAHPELVNAVADAHTALARERADLEADATDWGAELREQARIALSQDPDLARAYEVKEAFVAASLLVTAQPQLAMAAMDRWSALAQGCGLVPFAKLGRRLEVWRPELESHLTPGRPAGSGAARSAGSGAAGAARSAVSGAAGARAGWSGRLGRRPRDHRTFTRARPAVSVVVPIVALLVVAGFVAAPLGLSWMPFASTDSYIPDWISWNYTGYQGKSTYPEYSAINNTMANVGAKYGCGRAMWEYGPELNDLGTPEALMLLPFWTHGCIDSMEGLLFESSSTTPYHFLNQAELSQTPSEAETGLPYGTLNVALGVQHLQLLGVRYYMAFTPAAESEANADPALKLIANTGPWPTVVNGTTIQRTWDVYLVADSTTVTPLDTRPVVLTGVDKGSAQSWLNASLTWYDDPSLWNVMEAENGPSAWSRVPAGTNTLPSTPLTPTTVSDIVNTDTTISFDVGQLGSPVLVKTSYYPNWQATGATGPYRVSPNLMVVVPTSHHVTLTYGRSAADWLGTAVTIAGLVGAGWMAWRPPVPMPEPVPSFEPPTGVGREDE